MKRMILAAALSLATSAFAQICEVDMIDIRTQRFITSFTAYDYNDGCKEGMKACRLEIRQRGQLGLADCVRVGNSTPVPTPIPTPVPRPEPYPRPQPQPYPRPYPNPNQYDARRPVSIGESVIYSNQLQTVIGIGFNGTVALRDSFGITRNNIPRASLAVTNGCNGNICAGDQLISLSSLIYVTVAGLSYDDTYVTQDTFNILRSGQPRTSLAQTRGCVSSRYAQICVGDQVINNYNQYSFVAGIQFDGNVVLKDTFNILRANINPSTLTITR